MKARFLVLGGSLLSALLFSLAMVMPAFAAGTDGDGLDGDETLVPLFLVGGAVVLIGVIAYLVVCMAQSPARRGIERSSYVSLLARRS